jgi:hypothetical protein
MAQEVSLAGIRRYLWLSIERSFKKSELNTVFFVAVGPFRKEIAIFRPRNGYFVRYPGISLRSTLFRNERRVYRRKCWFFVPLYMCNERFGSFWIDGEVSTCQLLIRQTFGILQEYRISDLAAWIFCRVFDRFLYFQFYESCYLSSRNRRMCLWNIRVGLSTFHAKHPCTWPPLCVFWSAEVW